MTHIRTQAVHAGHQADAVTGAIATGIAQTSAFAYGTLDRGEALFANPAEGYTYSRFSNPTTAALQVKIAALEGADAACVFASGMAATSALVLALLKPGDEIAFLGPLYGGTESLFRGLAARFGVRVTAIEDGDLAAGLPETTRMVWVETPTNPTLRLHDLTAVAQAARACGAVTVADNTFCTPCLTRPLVHGIDVVMHSMTKYLGGHGDAIGGVVAGPERLMKAVRQTGFNHLGATLAPHTAYLFLRGLKTLPLRMAAHCEGAAAVAAFLEAHPAVQRVHYPGLASHPGHEVAVRQMRGGFGGIVAFELVRPGRAAAAAFLDGLQLFFQSASLGDVSSLACHPATTIHSFISAEARARHGITDALIRLSIGIEHADDLVADVAQALARVEALGIAREAAK